MEKTKEQKRREIRSAIIGMAVIKTLAKCDEDVHIHYSSESKMPMP